VQQLHWWALQSHKRICANTRIITSNTIQRDCRCDAMRCMDGHLFLTGSIPFSVPTHHRSMLELCCFHNMRVHYLFLVLELVHGLAPHAGERTFENGHLSRREMTTLSFLGMLGICSSPPPAFGMTTDKKTGIALPDLGEIEKAVPKDWLDIENPFEEDNSKTMFGRLDSQPDSVFYTDPRFVEHVDTNAVRILTDYVGNEAVHDGDSVRTFNIMFPKKTLQTHPCCLILVSRSLLILDQPPHPFFQKGDKICRFGNECKGTRSQWRSHRFPSSRFELETKASVRR